MKKLITLIVACFAVATQAQTIGQLKKDMYGIASDATEGRFTASPGYLRAANYVVARLKADGLKPRLQSVPFIWDKHSGSSLNIKGHQYPHTAANFIVLQLGQAKKGKWLVLAPGDSLKGKAAGIILLPDANQRKDWETTVIRQYRFGYMHYLPDGMPAQQGVPTIIVSPLLAQNLNSGDSVTVTLKHRRENQMGYNVIALLPGTNPKLRHQTIVIGAHLDHIGRIGNHIYNGANDDASGCVAELGAAKVLANPRTARPVMFAFFCGEELNLKGSRWFNAHLPIPAKDILMSINLEQLGSKHRSFHGVWALGDTTYQQVFFSSGKGFSRKDLEFSPTDSVKEILSNTDSYSFMNNGIPSLLLGSGGFDEHHTPEDKISLIDFPHLRKASLLLIQLIRQIADHQL